MTTATQGDAPAAGEKLALLGRRAIDPDPLVRDQTLRL